MCAPLVDHSLDLGADRRKVFVLEAVQCTKRTYISISSSSSSSCRCLSEGKTTAYLRVIDSSKAHGVSRLLAIVSRCSTSAGRHSSTCFKAITFPIAIRESRGVITFGTTTSCPCSIDHIRSSLSESKRASAIACILHRSECATHTLQGTHQQSVEVDEVRQLLRDVEEPSWVVEKDLDHVLAATTAQLERVSPCDSKVSVRSSPSTCMVLTWHVGCSICESKHRVGGVRSCSTCAASLWMSKQQRTVDRRRRLPPDVWVLSSTPQRDYKHRRERACEYL